MKSASAAYCDKGGCSLVNFSSVYGIMPPHFEVYDDTQMTMPVEYSAIKSAIIHMSSYFAKYYLKNDIRINCVSPGGIFDDQDQTFIKNYCKHTNNSGLLMSDELNEICGFLLNSNNIAGQNLIVDNGFSL